MSAKHFTRRLGVAWGRSFSSSTLRRTAGNGGAGRTSSASPQHPPKWSGRSVLALAAGAGIFGFGIATTGLQTPPRRTVVLLDSKIPSPEYASVDEMEAVRYFLSLLEIVRPNAKE
jgi:D-lactate dehydrogenase (cytochrome)